MEFSTIKINVVNPISTNSFKNKLVAIDLSTFWNIPVLSVMIKLHALHYILIIIINNNFHVYILYNVVSLICIVMTILYVLPCLIKGLVVL